MNTLYKYIVFCATKLSVHLSDKNVKTSDCFLSINGYGMLYAYTDRDVHSGKFSWHQVESKKTNVLIAYGYLFLQPYGHMSQF